MEAVLDSSSQLVLAAGPYPLAGGRPLRALTLTTDMFEFSGVMLPKLKVTQLAAELGEREAPTSGLKGALQQRLREVIITAMLKQRETERAGDGATSD